MSSHFARLLSSFRSPRVAREVEVHEVVALEHRGGSLEVVQVERWLLRSAVTDSSRDRLGRRGWTQPVRALTPN